MTRGGCPSTSSSQVSSPPPCPSGTTSSTSNEQPCRPRTPAESSACQPSTPCGYPAIDYDPPVILLTNYTYAPGETVSIRLRNDGDHIYAYSQTQASCDLGIYTDVGRRISLGVCSDYVTNDRLEADGAEVDYWTWNLSECVGSGPWYGGCDQWMELPSGTYHLRQTFCVAPSASGSATSSSGGTSNSGDCTRTGADLVVW
ncbi:MAG: hypothetical protein WC876_11860 [Candidatus Thermoplasmatota archaeon]|jgi:hypothetical protein